MEALLAAAEREFGGLLPRLKAELGGGGVPDLDAFETSMREGLFACGAAGYAALLAVKCCLENNRWADFLDWRDRRVAAA